MAMLTRWDPFADLANMQRDLDRLMGGARFASRGSGAEGELALVPSVDVITRAEDLVVRAEMPGVKPEDVDVSATGRTLKISGSRHEEHETHESDYVMRETVQGHYERTLTLPEGVEPSRLHADYHDGVLEIVVPGAAQTPAAQEVKIPIESAQSEPVQQAPAQVQGAPVPERQAPTQPASTSQPMTPGPQSQPVQPGQPQGEQQEPQQQPSSSMTPRW